MRYLVTYVEDDSRIKQNSMITLKDHADPDRLWRVVSLGEVTRDKKDIKTTWHNNI